MPAITYPSPLYAPESLPLAEQLRTVIVLLNWNGAEDTIDCVRSLLRMDAQDFVIVICDNCSTDGSFKRLLTWGQNELKTRFATWQCGETPLVGPKVILIETGANLGFAGGCNVGLRYALLHTKADFVWLLNNDTVVHAESLAHQLAAMKDRPSVGILGSTLIYFNEPDRLQAAAGYDFNFWTARVIPLTNAFSPSNLPSTEFVEENIKYVSGASMLVRRKFIETVGLLNEQYFLYFEEVDWAVRGQADFKLGYCAESIVWHKEGRSIGSNSSVSQRSFFSEGYLTRNRVLFIKTYFPRRLFLCILWLSMVGIMRILSCKLQLALVLWKGTKRGLAAPRLPLPEMTQWPASMRPPPI